jgi:hypothetical protein
VTLSHPFLEGFPAFALIQVAEPWFLGCPSPELGRSTEPESVSMALYAEKSWSYLVLIPASGKSSSDSGSESRVYSSGGSGTGIETS